MNLDNFGMLWFFGLPILCLLVGILITFILYLVIKKEKVFDTICYIGWALFSVIGIIVWLKMSIYIDRKIVFNYEERVVANNEIIAINDNTSVNGYIYGRRFYVRGLINETWQYSVYQNVGENYSLINIPANTTIIYERDETPHYVQYCSFRLAKEMKIFLFNIKEPEINTGNCRYDLIIPIGTINSEYNLDLNG